MLEGSTTSKTTLRISLVLIWFDDSPYSIKGLGKIIDPTIVHKDQLMKISSFFNTHTHTKRYPLTWTKSDKLLSSNSPSCCLAYPTSSGYPTRILGEGVVYRITQLDHELNIAVRWQPGNTSEKTFGTSRTTDMSLGSRSILPFRARRYDQISKGLNNPNSSIEGCTEIRTR